MHNLLLAFFGAGGVSILSSQLIRVRVRIPPNASAPPPPVRVEPPVWVGLVWEGVNSASSEWGASEYETCACASQTYLRVREQSKKAKNDITLTIGEATIH